MAGLAIIVDLHTKGLCFNYREKWFKGHKGKSIPTKFHMIEILEEDHLEVDGNETKQIT
jgi:hypothetical protein